MNQSELIKEITSDFEEVIKRTLFRLCSEYTKERKKLKIAKDKDYQRCYEIRSKRKNHWILIFSKESTVPYFTGNVESMSVSFYTYYIDKTGLKAFHIDYYKKIEMYNGHVFHRYNERMNLGLPSVLEAAKMFFKNNYQAFSGEITYKDKTQFIHLIKDGFVFSEQQDQLMIYKTFISKDLAREDQSDLKDQILTFIKQAIDDNKTYSNVSKKQLQLLYNDLTS